MNNEIVLFEAADGKVALPVQMKEETVWLTQAQMAQLFDKDRTVIGRHIRNALAEGEIDAETMCAKFAHMGKDADQTYWTEAYNLDVIISVGYRVHSQRGGALPLLPQAQPPPTAQGRLQAHRRPHACRFDGDDRRIQARRKGNDGQPRHDLPRLK